jgi:hypothetical protein
LDDQCSGAIIQALTPVGAGVTRKRNRDRTSGHGVLPVLQCVKTVFELGDTRLTSFQFGGSLPKRCDLNFQGAVLGLQRAVVR